MVDKGSSFADFERFYYVIISVDLILSSFNLSG